MAKFLNVFLKVAKVVGIVVFVFLIAFEVGRNIELKLFNTITDAPQDSAISVTFYDVNQADCTLISFSDKWILIDCGGYATGKLLDRYFSKLGIESFDAVFFTHPDADHYGGMLYLKDKYKVKHIYQPDMDFSEVNETYIDLIEELESTGAENTYLVSGDSLSMDGVRFSVMGPVFVSEETNDMSLVMRISYGKFSLLYCGDMEEDEVSDIIDEHSGELGSDILKVAHHGSKSGTNSELLDEISPKYAIISVGENTYHLPNYKVMELLSEYDLDVLTTQDYGNITINYTNKYEITTERNKLS